MDASGCGLHITEALAGLPLEKICICDDDRDSEHSWTIASNNITNTFFTPGLTTRITPQYPFSSSAVTTIPTKATTAGASSTSGISTPPYTTPSEATTSKRRIDPTGHCDDPSPVEYRLSKISATTAEAAASRMVQQAAALEELRRIKQKKEQELKAANESALQRLLQGLSEASEDAN
ncbi:hypothetical protein BGZ99_009757 [Dissophora globulifera]|uniref:Uncharacterized protein n=1 Tax=Dissophora globulifera TaxID=979702 RepID=A0A9P6RS88_9FUNG|nr:hypothetical protein BGZ99_009757 [Dissophora globulifera]